MNNKIINENINLRAENKRLKQQIKDLKSSNRLHRFNSKNQEECIDSQYRNIVEKNNKIDNLVDLYDNFGKEYRFKLKEYKNKYLSELRSINDALNDYKNRYDEIYSILNSYNREDLRIQKFKNLVKDICKNNGNMAYELKRPIWVEPQTRELRNCEDICSDSYLQPEIITMRKFSIFDLIEERL